MCSYIVLLDLRKLDHENSLLLEKCSRERREKILRQKSLEGKRQSLGAELCFLAAAKLAGISGEYYRLPDGRPQPKDEGWHMSLTHAEELAVCVLSKAPVGIDAEKADRSIKTEMERMILSEGEEEDLLTCWVKKESYLKRTGEGIRRKMSDFKINDTDGYIFFVQQGEYYISVSCECKTDFEIHEYSAEEIFNLLQ